MNWDELMCYDTLSEDLLPEPKWSDYPMDGFENDYNKIISLFLFRRLQDKAQIFSLDRGDYVRTRLTHSLEVSTIGSQLGIMVAKTSERKDAIAPLNERPDYYANKLSTLLKSAGLLHDLGNPPFGHYGEKVISVWFRDAFESGKLKYKGFPLSRVLTPRMISDIVNFDGNAQTMHLLLKSSVNPSRYNPNLSTGLLSVMLKYTASSTEVDKKCGDHRIHKYGYYLADDKLVHEIRQKTGVEPNGRNFARNPLTFLMEASDDIAYVCSDLEDSIQRGIFSPIDLALYFLDTVNSMPEEGEGLYEVQLMSAKKLFQLFYDKLREANSMHDQKSIVVIWLNRVKSWLMHSAAYSFCENADEIMNGTYQNEVLDDSYHKITVDVMKSAMRKYVYSNKEKLRTELASNRILCGLLDDFIPACVSFDSDDKVDSLTDGFSNLIPAHLKIDYERTKTGDEAFDIYLRILMGIDYISGMTDSYASNTFKRLNALN